MATGTDEELDAMLGIGTPIQVAEQPSIVTEQSAQIPTRQATGGDTADLDSILGFTGLPKPEEVQAQAQAIQPQEAPEPVSQDFSIGKTIKNIPASAGRLVSDIATAVTSPLETAGAITKLAVGGVQKLLPEPKERTTISPQGKIIHLSGKDHRESWNQFSDAMGERYGGWDNIKKTVETDPVGFLADISAAMMPVAGTVGRVGVLTEPVTIARNIIGAAGKKISPAIQKKLYISALKMQISKKVSVAERIKRAETGLEKGVLPTSSGLKKLNREIRRADLQVQRTVSKGARKGDMVAIDDILKPVAKIREKAKHSLDSEAILKSIDDMEAALRNHPDVVSGKLPTGVVNEVKKRAGADLDGKFGQAQKLEIEARKSIGHGAMLELEKKYPEIRALNKDSGAMRSLRGSLETAIKRLENNNVISLSDWIVMTGGGAGGGAAGAAGSIVLKKIISSPRIKALTAMALKRVESLPRIPQVAIPSQIAARGGGELQRQRDAE